jgi:hypothetical protein
MTTPNIDPKRLDEVNQRALMTGKHDSIAQGMCVMEAVSYVAGEPWSDHPQCASRVIAAFMRRWNDGLRSDEDRKRLLAPLIPKLVGSAAGDEIELKRAYLAVDWVIRVMSPTWLELAGLTEQATLLRELSEVTDEASARLARAAANQAYKAASRRRDERWAELRQKYAYAYADAADAAAYAAADAAAAYADAAAAYADAAYAAADAAAAYAYAADAAAAYAAGKPLTAEARAKLRADVRERLQPTVEQLQQSAVDLVERMIALGGSSETAPTN